MSLPLGKSRINHTGKEQAAEPMLEPLTRTLHKQ